jgi:hypothetical protein
LGVHVWYISYGDNADQIQVTSAAVQDLKQRITTKDPNAVLEEIRLLPFTVGVKVNHTTWTTMKRADGTVLVYDKQQLVGPIFLVVLAILAITAIWVTAYVATTIQAHISYLMETIQYPCPGDPNRPNEECGMHTDAQGNVLVFTGKEALRAHMASAHPTALTYMVNNNLVDRDLGTQKAWYEQIVEWIPVVIMLIGAAIVIPLVMKIIPGKEAG